MSTGKILGYIGSAILILFGILWIIGATSGVNTGPRLVTGIIMLAIGLGIIILVKLREPQKKTIVQKLELPATAELESLKCKNCGARLDEKSIKVTGTSVVVTCPYCDSVYELREAPKW
ncbi:MAG: hypothetical protein J7M18_01185 [Candidatus Eremiobacteraeota bacterium]|nr:hypothetical protein [Candidatus Eremiobacteraeota bacterium]